MKKLIFLFLFTAFSLIKAEGILKFSSDDFRDGARIGVTYTPDERFAANSDVKLLAYTYNHTSTLPSELQFQLNYSVAENAYKGEVVVPEGTQYMVFKIYSTKNGKEIYDDNYSNFWEAFVKDSSGKIKKNAYLKAAALNMGSSLPNIAKAADFNKALAYMQKELELYPDNITAQIARTSFELDVKKINFDQYTSRMNEIMQKSIDFNDEATVKAVVRALKSLNKKDQAEKLEMDFLLKYPKSELAEEIMLAFLGQANSRAKFTEIATQFLKNYPNSTSRQTVFNALVNGYLQNGKLNELLGVLDTLGEVPVNVYVYIADQLITKDNYFKNMSKAARESEALRIYQLKLDEQMSADKSVFNSLKPLYLAPVEWARQSELLMANTAEIGGKIFMYKGEFEKAASFFETARTSYKESAPVNLYENQIASYRKINSDSIAFAVSEEAILNSKFSTPIAQAHKELYSKSRDTSDYSKYLDSLALAAKAARQAGIKYEMLNLGPISGVLETFDGRYIDMEDFKGKAVVLAFWSSWCGPCQAFLPSFDVFNNAYKGRDDVVIAAVNIWDYDKTKNQIAKFLNDMDVDFMVYLDKTDILSRKMSVTGLPMTVFIDKDGIIRFKEYGFANEADFIQKADDRIEALK